MSLPQRVSDVLKDHVVLELESIDRMYLNVYQPKLQTPSMVYGFLRNEAVRGSVSSKCFQATTQAFVKSIEVYAASHGIAIGFGRVALRTPSGHRVATAKAPFDS